MDQCNSNPTDKSEYIRALALFVFELGSANNCANTANNYGNQKQCMDDLYTSILSVLQPIATTESQKSQRFAIVALGNLCAKTGPKFNVLQQHVFGILKDLFFSKNTAGLDSQIAIQVMKSLTILINESKQIALDSTFSILPTLIHHLIPSQDQLAAWKKLKGESKSPAKRFESDSEYSDADTSAVILG